MCKKTCTNVLEPAIKNQIDSHTVSNLQYQMYVQEFTTLVKRYIFTLNNQKNYNSIFYDIIGREQSLQLRCFLSCCKAH